MTIVCFAAPVDRAANVATAFTLTLSAATGVTGTPVTVTVTPNGSVPADTNVILSVDSGTLALSGFLFPAGSFSAQSTTLTRATDGTSTLTMSNDGGLGNNGTPAAFTSSNPYINAPTSAVTGTVFFIGDSITSENYGATPFNMALAMLGGNAPKIVQNSGHEGQSISGLISQIDLSYVDLTGGPMGLVGMTPTGWGFLRIGTNNVRGASGSTGVPIDGGMQADYVTLINKLLLYCEHLAIFPVPPIGGITLAKNTAVQGYNDYLRSLVIADTTGRLHWIDDCADLTDVAGNVKTGYMHPTDELHPFPPGMYRMALTALPQLQSLFSSQAYTSGISTSAADVYPAQPQWVGNHVNAGTGGTLGTGITGTAPNGWDVTCSSGAACAVSIVSADVGDTNTTPWLRFTPSAGAAAGYIGADITGGGAAVTTTTPLDIEQIAEVRFNAVDATKLAEVWLGLQVGSFYLPKHARIRVDGWNEGTITRSWSLRKATHRKDNNAGGSTVRNKFVINTNAFSGGGAGSVDVRCYTNRG